MPKPLILLVVEDAPTRAQIRSYLEAEFVVQEAADSVTCLSILGRRAPDLLLLDARVSKLDGWEILRRIRSGPETPVVLLRSRNVAPDWAFGLPLGADDYVLTPIDRQDLMDRVKALLEQSNPIMPSHPIIACGDLVLGILERKAVWKGRTLKLSPKEFDLLALLAAHAGQPLSREQILARVWGPRSSETADTVDKCIKHLRFALGDGAGMVRRAWGRGYQFTPEGHLPMEVRDLG